MKTISTVEELMNLQVLPELVAGAKRACYRIHFSKYNCKDINSLPVWQNDDGTFTVGGIHTIISALQQLGEKGNLKKCPQITLDIVNDKFKLKDNFLHAVTIEYIVKNSIQDLNL